MPKVANNMNPSVNTDHVKPINPKKMHEVAGRIEIIHKKQQGSGIPTPQGSTSK